MNIGIVTTWFDRGGGMVGRAYRDILAPHFNVFIYARAGEVYAKNDPRWDGGYVTWQKHLRDGAPLTRIRWRPFEKWVRSNHIDVLIFNEQQDWPAVVFSRQSLGVPIGAYVDYYNALTVPFFELYDFLLCNTQRHYSVFAGHAGAWYIPWGTDCQLFRANCTPVRQGCVVFFHSAGMSPERKGTMIALKAFWGLGPEARLVLHIQKPLNQYPEIVRLCRADPRITVIEKTIPAPGAYHLGDVYVYPALLDGIGLTVPEALASGLPVIATDSPPLSEFVRHGENGLLVAPHQQRARPDGYYWPEAVCRPEDVRSAMRFYLDRRDQMAQFKARARASAEEKLDWSRNAAQLPRLLRDTVSRGPRSRDTSDLEAAALDYSKPRRGRRYIQMAAAKLGLKRFRALDHWVYS